MPLPQKARNHFLSFISLHFPSFPPPVPRPPLHFSPQSSPLRRKFSHGGVKGGVGGIWDSGSSSLACRSTARMQVLPGQHPGVPAAEAPPNPCHAGPFARPHTCRFSGPEVNGSTRGGGDGPAAAAAAGAPTPAGFHVLLSWQQGSGAAPAGGGGGAKARPGPLPVLFTSLQVRGRRDGEGGGSGGPGWRTMLRAMLRAAWGRACVWATSAALRGLPAPTERCSPHAPHHHPCSPHPAGRLCGQALGAAGGGGGGGRGGGRCSGGPCRCQGGAPGAAARGAHLGAGQRGRQVGGFPARDQPTNGVAWGRMGGLKPGDGDLRRGPHQPARPCLPPSPPSPHTHPCLLRRSSLVPGVFCCLELEVGVRGRPPRLHVKEEYKEGAG